MSNPKIDIPNLAKNLTGLNEAELALALERLLRQQTEAAPAYQKEVNGNNVLISTMVGVKVQNGGLVPCELGDEAQVGRFVAIYGHGFQGDGNGGYQLNHLDNYKFSRFEAQEGTTERRRTVQTKDMGWAVGGCVLLMDISFGAGGPELTAVIPAIVGNGKARVEGREGFSVSFDQRVAGIRNEDIKPLIEGLLAQVWGYCENPIGDGASLEATKAAVARINRFGVSADRAATSRQVIGTDGKVSTMAPPATTRSQTTTATGSGNANMAALAAARQAAAQATAARAANG